MGIVDAIRGIFGGHEPLTVCWMVIGVLFFISTCKMYMQIARVRGVLYTAFLVWMLFLIPSVVIEGSLLWWPVACVIISVPYLFLTFDQYSTGWSSKEANFKPWDWSGIVTKRRSELSLSEKFCSCGDTQMSKLSCPVHGTNPQY